MRASLGSPLPFFPVELYLSNALSDAQATQIREIFELFDTDGGGCIDQRELQFAMTALGFQTKENHRATKHKEAMEVMDDLIGDGKVTLEEFSALMTGEISGQDPYEEARAVFTVLSRPDAERAHDGLITLNKLEDVCSEYKVPAPRQTRLCRLLTNHSVPFTKKVLRKFSYLNHPFFIMSSKA